MAFEDKGEKSREIPVRHDLEGFLEEYVDAGELAGDEKGSLLFRRPESRRDSSPLA